MNKLSVVVTLLFVTAFATKAQNVGVGTSNPNTKLQINGDAGTDLLDVKDESNATRFYIENDGNVGIGTSSPNAKLHINGSSANNTPDLIIDNADALIQLGDGTSGPHGITFGDDGTEGLQLMYRTSGNQLIIEKGNNTSDNDDLFWVDYDTEYAYFRGNVGMGTTSPVAKLHVAGDIYFPNRALIAAGANLNNTSTNIDHIWHDDIAPATGLGGTWHFVSDGAYKDEGNALVKAKSFEGWGIVPIGSIIAWHKNLGGVPSLPDGWVECNGATISDIESPMNGQAVPNLNGATTSSSGDASYGRFLRGHTSSGVFQSDVSNNIYAIEKDDADGGARSITIDDDGNWSAWSKTYNSDDRSRFRKHGRETRVTNMSVVWVMRVK